MDDILNNFRNLKIDNKNICILCHNYYDKSLFYKIIQNIIHFILYN